MKLNTIEDFIKYYKGILPKCRDNSSLHAYFCGYVDGLIMAQAITERHVSVDVFMDKMVLELDEDEKTL